jgi:hypothetical protein
MFGRSIPACPVCASASVVPIVYGLVQLDDDRRAALDRGEFVVGGCVPDFSKSWLCRECGNRFGDPEDAEAD